MVYSNMIITCMKWLLFLLLPVVKCHHAGGEKTASFPVFFFFEKKKAVRREGKPHVMNGGNLQSATLYKFS